jgi:hypothetical protein
MSKYPVRTLPNGLEVQITTGYIPDGTEIIVVIDGSAIALERAVAIAEAEYAKGSDAHIWVQCLTVDACKEYMDRVVAIGSVPTND